MNIKEEYFENGFKKCEDRFRIGFTDTDVDGKYYPTFMFQHNSKYYCECAMCLIISEALSKVFDTLRTGV